MEESLPNQTQIRKWLSPITILFLLYAIFFLPFWEPLLLAFIFACALSPATHYLHQKFHSSEKKTSYVLLTGLILLILAILVLGGLKIFSLLYAQLQNMESLNSNFTAYQEAQRQIVQWLQHIPFLNDRNIEQQVSQALTSIGSQTQAFAIEAAKTFVIRTPEILLNLFIFLAAMVVLLAWGERKWKYIGQVPGLGSSTDMKNYRHFEKVCAISIGSIFLTGFLQATLVGIGAAITGFPAFVSFLVAFILSLIPVLGAASVPVFLAIISYANGSSGSAVILLVTALIAGTSDNILRAWLFSKASNSNPVVSLLALLGGISLFGFAGLFLAPIVEQLVMSYLQNGEMRERKKLVLPKRWKGWSARSPHGDLPPRPI